MPIPRTIHYCWLSQDKFPPSVQLCKRTWAVRLPDMHVKRWDADAFDKIPNKPDWVKRAYDLRLWAFVADYVRQYAVYTEGGWYFDSDVFVLQKNFTSAYCDYACVCPLENSYFAYGGTAVEHDGYTFGIGMQAACFGGAAGNAMCGETLRIYDGFGDYVGRLYEQAEDCEMLIAPQIMAKAAENLGMFRKGEYSTYECCGPGGKYVFVKDLCVNGGLKKLYGAGGTPYCAKHLCMGDWRDKIDDPDGWQEARRNGVKKKRRKVSKTKFDNK